MNGTGFPWALIVTQDNGYAESMGMYTDYIGVRAAFDAKKYPYLLRCREPFMKDPYEDPPYKEEYAKKHFISMLRYKENLSKNGPTTRFNILKEMVLRCTDSQ